ncbi:hypothetical protein NX059_000359 [Plenodomus lindquistii]|nr:hypothetical protein NX059_000359 [Plenodomus lindquistii]
MPHYSIHHSTPLTPSQTAALARKITNLHTTLFSAPSIFVNITFHPTTPSTQTTFVGGRQVRTNYINGFLRPRGPEKAAELKTLVLEIGKAWEEIVVAPATLRVVDDEDVGLPLNLQRKRGAGNGGDPTMLQGSLANPLTLHNIFIHGTIVTGAEQGFLLPLAGQDDQWLEENMAEFKRRADVGDESMRKLVGEVRIKSKL